MFTLPKYLIFFWYCTEGKCSTIFSNQLVILQIEITIIYTVICYCCFEVFLIQFISTHKKQIPVTGKLLNIAPIISQVSNQSFFRSRTCVSRMFFFFSLQNSSALISIHSEPQFYQTISPLQNSSFHANKWCII